MKPARKKVLPVSLSGHVQEWVEREAEKNCRTMNQEVAFHLKEAMERSAARKVE